MIESKSSDKKEKPKRLSQILALALMVFSVLSLLVASSFQITLNFQTQKRAIIGQQHVIALGAAEKVSNAVDLVFAELETSGRVGRPFSSSAAERWLLLQSLLELNSNFNEIALVDSLGHELVKVSRHKVYKPSELINLTEHDLFQRINRKSRYIGSLYFDEDTNEPGIMVAIPITNLVGNFEGGLVAKVSLKFVWDLVSSLKVGEKGVAYIVDRNGKLIAFHDVQKVLQGENLTHLEQVARFVDNGDEFLPNNNLLVTGITGVYSLTMYVPLGLPDWAIIVEMPVSEAYLPVILSMVFSIGIVIIVALLAIAAGLRFARHLAAPVNDLTATAARIAGGNLELKAPVGGSSEVRGLADAFNSMTAQLRNLIHSLESKVSELEQKEGALRESESKYRRIFENVEDGYIRAAMDGTILSVNPATVRMLGYDIPTQLEGKNMLQDVYADPEQQENLKIALNENGTIKGHLLDFFHHNGNKISAECNLHLILNEANKPLSIEGTFRDVTERNRVEKELQKYRESLEELVKARTNELSIANERLKELDKLKSMFIASMSHELRTPLNSIIGFTGLTLGGKVGELDPKHKDFLSRSYKSAKHLLALISDVIDISKVESGVVQAYPELFFLNEVLTEAVDSSSSHKKEAVDLKTNIPEGIEIYSDRQRVLQCILNLLSNALKYTKEGSVHLSAVEADDQIEIRVEDTGIGISEADMERLFQPFERLNSPMRIKEAGTGLGLYLTRKLTAEVLDGSLRVESSLGKGSTFYLTLPKRLEPRDPVTQTSILETT